MVNLITVIPQAETSSFRARGRVDQRLQPFAPFLELAVERGV